MSVFIRRLVQSASVTLVMIVCGLAQAQQPEQVGDAYVNPTLGFSIGKPASWHYLTAEQHRAHLKATDFADPAFKNLVAKYSRTPFLAMSKHQEPYDDLNPTLRVNIREAGGFKGAPPDKIAAATAAVLARVLKDYAVAEGPLTTTVSGRVAGNIRVNYTLQAGELQLPATSEVWIVPRGDLLFLIGSGTRQDEKSGSRKEVRDIVNTIKIE